MAPSKLSLVILGASGVTGKQAVPYLGERAGELGVAWGIAGRSPEKLEALVADWPVEERPEIIPADVADSASIHALAERTEAIVNFAGPFARMAPPVIEAAVGAGIAYVDVTGEMHHAAEMCERWHEAAEQSGARIVQVCGFESLPFDLSAIAAVERLSAEHGAEAVEVEAIFGGTPPPGRPRASDMVSNGTFESLREALAGEGAKVLGDPASLLGDLADAEEVRRVSPILSRPRRKQGVGILAPMIPSPVINPPVIQRSLALSGRRPLNYHEHVAAASLVPTRPLQAVVAGTTAAINGGLGLVSRAPAPVRRAGTNAMKVFSPAGGPDEDRLEGWSWRIETTASAADGRSSVVTVTASGHPGYLATSRMTTEAGLILADPEADKPERAGYLTPSAALGTAELGRFAHAQVEFS